MNSAARVRAGDSVREHIEVPTVGFFVWIRFPAPCHTHSGATLKELHMVTQLSKNLPSKTLSPGKRKPTVIFVAVLGPKVHPIKGCFSVFPQPLCCYIWLFALYIGVKLVKPLPGLESGAGAASCCNCCRSRQLGQHKETLWGFQLRRSTSLLQAAIQKTQFGQLGEGEFLQTRPGAHPDVEVILTDKF